MLQKPMDVLEQFPVRKKRQQKQAFRASVQQYAESLGYECKEEKGSFGSVNVVLGDSAKAKFLVTAHYDTCARFPVPNLITPCSFWGYLGYQILVALIILLPIFLSSLVVGLLTGSGLAARLVGFVMLYVAIILMLVGPANKNNANDNTSGVVTVLEMARNMPQELREQVCFVLFDLEEAGLWGSSSYRSKHKKESNDQIVLNVDCVGDGDLIMLFPKKKIRKNLELMEKLKQSCGSYGNKQVTILEEGFSTYPSDQSNFPYGVGICALRQGKFGPYLSRIHTPKDTILEEANVQLLSKTLTEIIRNY